MQHVRYWSVVLALVSALQLFAAGGRSPFSGRWDLTIMTATGAYPSWMEFADEGATPAIRIVGRTGSVHAVRAARVEGSQLSFEDPASSGSARWQIILRDGKLTGQTSDGGLRGVQAPALRHKAARAWTNPEPLIPLSGDLSGWVPDNPAVNHWVARNGVLENLEAGANIRTMRTFLDFRLHVEYNCPLGGNSGVYLRGRYEVQVEYEPSGKNDAFHGMGSIYGFIAPARLVEPRPGKWETYDVTLVGRTVTVVRDGVPIIDEAEIPGITGGALDSREGEPGPIYLQGDHTGGLKYRNITIAVPR
ncbi:MAG: DUF1080 domain-containing protein [Bryobacterales bacterium]|nr:DUF1080 domain-containing protein [Bryobacterales bacterium]